MIIWQCVFAELPFSTSDTDEASASSDTERIRTAIAANRLPWNDAEPKDAILRQILQLVKSCCNVRPHARPSAGQVLQRLNRIVHLAPMLQTVENAEEIKSAVAMKLEANPEDHSENPSLADEELKALRTLIGSGDAQAAYLLGKAIHEDQAPADPDAEQLLLLPGVEQTKGNK